VLHDSKVKAIRFKLMRVPSKLLESEAVGVGGNQALGAVVVLLVKDSTAAVQGGGVDRDEEGLRKVGNTREDGTRERMLEDVDGGEESEGAKDAAMVTALLTKLVERAANLGEVRDAVAVVTAHTKEGRGGLGR